MTDKDARSPSKKDLVRIINRLEEENERLRTKLAISKKDSSTSGKPPSSDIVKRPGTPKGKKKGKGKKKKRGAQPGHPRHERQAFAGSEIDIFYEYGPERCGCGCRLQNADGSRDQTLQQVEIQKSPLQIVEHRAKERTCPGCGRTYKGTSPT